MVLDTGATLFPLWTLFTFTYPHVTTNNKLGGKLLSGVQAWPIVGSSYFSSLFIEGFQSFVRAY